VASKSKIKAGEQKKQFLIAKDFDGIPMEGMFSFFVSLWKLRDKDFCCCLVWI
jgi:hypothetical protein